MGGDVGALDAQRNRHLAGGGAGHGLCEEARAPRRGAVLDEFSIILRVCQHAAESGAEGQPEALRFGLRNLQLCGVDGEVRGGEKETAQTIEPSDVCTLVQRDDVQRNFADRGAPSSVHTRERRKRAFAGAESRRQFTERCTQRRDDTDAADNHRIGHTSLRNTIAALLPANAEEVERTVRAAWRRGTPTTRSTPHDGSGCSQLSVAEIMPVRSTCAHMIASKVPAAASVWPRAPLIELTGMRAAASPKTLVIAAISIASLYTVPVPWALMKSISGAVTRASRRAMRMARAAPAPSRAGAAICVASPASPAPTTSTSMRAPRARACARSSTMRTAAPSPHRGPARPPSNGRTTSAVVARKQLKPFTTNEQTVSAPPTTKTSA